MSSSRTCQPRGVEVSGLECFVEHVVERERVAVVALPVTCNRDLVDTCALQLRTGNTTLLIRSCVKRASKVSVSGWFSLEYSEPQTNM